MPPPPFATPDAEVDVDTDLVAGLLADQHPDLSGAPLSSVPGGWDNLLWRLGDDLVVRLPRRAVAAALVGSEHAWLPHLAPRLPLPIPAPVRTGRPGRGYPWSWTITRWMPGKRADAAVLDADQGTTLGAFLVALHRPAPPEAPHNPVRGVPIASRAPRGAAALAAVAAAGADVDVALLGSVLDRATAAAPWSAEPRWLHGDLHPGNVVVRDGALAAVIDWGDICAGDPATDLAALWLVLDPDPRADALRICDPDPDTVTRARGWAVHLGATMAASGLTDDPQLAHIGLTALARIAADPRG